MLNFFAIPGTRSSYSMFAPTYLLLYVSRVLTAVIGELIQTHNIVSDLSLAIVGIWSVRRD